MPAHVRRFNEPGHVHFWTISCYRRLGFFHHQGMTPIVVASPGHGSDREPRMPDRRKRPAKRWLFFRTRRVPFARQDGLEAVQDRCGARPDGQTDSLIQFPSNPPEMAEMRPTLDLNLSQMVKQGAKRGHPGLGRRIDRGAGEG